MNNFIFYMKAIKMDGKLRDMVCSGKVTAIKGQQYTVHVYDPSAQHKCYLPGWVNGNKEKSQKKQPKGYTAETDTAKHRDMTILCSMQRRSLTPTGYHCRHGERSKRKEWCYPTSTPKNGAALSHNQKQQQQQQQQRL